MNPSSNVAWFYQRSPEVVELALYLSLAVVIEPALLRRARLTFLPRSEPGLEADLWFSPLVQARSHQTIVLRPDVAGERRQALAGQPAGRLEQVWAMTASLHQGAAPAIQLEEEIAYQALLGRPAADRRIDDLLRSAVARMNDPAYAVGMAAWAARALPRLPERARHFEAFAALTWAANILLGRRVAADLPPGLSPQAAGWIARILQNATRLDVGVRLLEGGLEFSDPGREGGHTLTVPKTDPVRIEVFPGEDRNQPPILVDWSPGGAQTVPLPGLVATLRTLAGDVYVLKPPPPARPDRPMGASLLPGGATFRVWAPNAEQVTVTGEFNGWSDTASPLQPEGNGVWSGEIHGAAAGQQYKYAITYQGQKRLRNDPYTRELSASAGNSVIPDERRDGPDPGFTPPPWNELVIYVLHVGTFNPGPDGPPGDFPSVMARLDDLVRLGVNAIQLLPVAEFGTELSWGYNPAQPFAVAQAYGGRSGFLDLVAAAHQRGLAVILDVVYSHFGPNNLDLWQFDGWSENKGGGIYFYNDFRAETPWGDTRPDYGRLEVQQYVRDNALMWLDECQVDGLRWDATAYIRNVQGSNDPANDLPDGWALMQSVNRAITALGPGKLSIAEDLPDQEMITRPAGEGGAGFAAQWDPDFGQSVRAVLTAVQDADRDLNPVIAAITHRYNQNAFQRVLYTESPNERPRLNEPLARKDPAGMPARPRAILGAALTLTAPGIPFLFQGQEFLESNAFSDQTPLDWSKATTHADVLGQYQELITLRRNLDGTTAGLLGQNVQVFHVNHKDKVLAFHRWDQGGPGDDVVVVVNLGGQAYRRYHLGLPRAGRWSVRFNSDPGADRAAQSFQQASEEGSDLTLTAVPKPEDELPYSGDVALGAYAVVILSQDVRREKATAA